MGLKGKNVFITGGAGFIGSHLAERILGFSPRSITIYDNLSSGRRKFLKTVLSDSRARLVVADLLDASKVVRFMRGHDLVFHLASNPDIAKSMSDPSLDFNLGLTVTFNVLEAMRVQRVKNIVFLSGSGIYGDVGARKTKEDFGPLKPISMYGATKLGAEAMISAFCHMFDMRGLIWRPANVVGSRQTHGVCLDFIKRLRHNPKKLVILGDGSQSKSYLDVDDLIDAVFLGLKRAHNTLNVFNVASRSFITVREITQIVIREMGLKNVRLRYTGGDRGWKGDVPKVRMDTSAIERLGWRSCLNSRQAIQKSVRQLIEGL